MKSAFVRLSLVVTAVAFAACGGGDEPGSAKLKSLKEGMSISEAISAMGEGPLTATYSDTMRLVGGYRRMRYLINGADFQVLYARDLPGDVKEPVLQARETPIVFRNDTLLGWGWRFFVDEGIMKYQIPTPLRATDTMTTPIVPDTANRANPKSAAPAPAVVPDTAKKS